MADESKPKARDLATALSALRSAANKAVIKPTLSRIVQHCADNGIEVADSTISGWLNGKSVPASAREFGVVVGFLNGFADRGDSNYECLSLPHWERLRRAAWEERRAAQGQRGASSRKETEPNRRDELDKSLYMTQVREFIAPIHGLQERQLELEMLADFCRSGHDPYLWVQGAPWAGKSALLASFVLNPPPNVTVISFFVTDRLAGQNDHPAFTAAILDQLAALMPDQTPRINAEVTARDALRNELIATAARRAASIQQRLVLVVDGLDEDAGEPSIAALLPARPHENLRVIVASRSGPRLTIPHDHPLATANHYQLPASEFAADIRDRAVAELDDILNGPKRNRGLLALITAARGLSVSELECLTARAPFEIDHLLRGVVGRSFRTITTMTTTDGEPDPVYTLAHEMLQRSAEVRLGALRLTKSLGRLHAWAEQYRDKGWPPDTPDFLLTRYPLVIGRDLGRLKNLLVDKAYDKRVLERTGTNFATAGRIRIHQDRTLRFMTQHRDESRPEWISTPYPPIRGRIVSLVINGRRII